MKEIRAIVLGSVVVVVAALMLAFWRRPAREFTRHQGIPGRGQENRGRRDARLSIHGPDDAHLPASRGSSHIDSVVDGDIRADWGKGDITPRTSWTRPTRAARTSRA